MSFSAGGDCKPNFCLAEGRKTENLALPESLSRLGLLANDIEKIQTHMTRVIGLWKDIRDKLTRMQSQVGKNDLVAGELDQEVENDWAEVAAQYKAYRDQVSLSLLRHFRS